MIAIATALGWGCDSAAARHAYAVGFALLDHAQHTVAERITTIRLQWLTGDNLATTRQAVAATGPELVGLIAYLVTPLLNALILPAAIGIGLLWFSPTLGAAALAFLPLLLGALALSMRLARSADAAADRAHAQLSERLLEFARTQQALRSARRVDTESSHGGLAHLRRADAVQLQRHLNVFEGRQGRDQVVVLEDVTNGTATHLSTVSRIHRGHIDAVDEDTSARRTLQSASDRQQGRLAGSRRAHNSEKLAGGDLKVDPVERSHSDAVGAEFMSDTRHPDR